MALELLTEGDEFTVCDKDLPGVSNGDKDATYRVRRLDPKTHKKFVKSHTKQEFIRGVGKVDRIDNEALAETIIDYIVVGWTGINLRGAPAPCSRELKLSGLDFARRLALQDLAGANDIASVPESRAESFPDPAAVL